MVPFCNRIGELPNIVQSKAKGLIDGNHHARIKKVEEWSYFNTSWTFSLWCVHIIGNYT